MQTLSLIRKNGIKNIALSLVTTLMLVIIIHAGWACTGIRIKLQDGTYIHGRTLDFDMDLHPSGFFIPRDYPFSGTLPDGSKGMSYRAKYAAIGAGTFGQIAAGDGINEQGLSVGSFYFQGYAEYAEVTAENKTKALSPLEFSNWLLTQFANVEEVKAAINSVAIVPTIPKHWPELPPLHYIVYDKTGKSIVIEPIKGVLKVYDNPLGILSNSPTFDWQMTNLANYINLSPRDITTQRLGDYVVRYFGSGTGLLGLPGDYSPPSRFVRAAFLSTAALPPANSEEGVLQAFHLLNTFDIPLGSVLEHEGDKLVPERTYVTVVRDPQHLRLYFKTFHDQSIRMIDLKRFNVHDKQIRKYTIEGQQAILEAPIQP